MNKKFTKLLAALALLTFLAVPMGMWGQASVTLTQSNLGLTGSYTTNTEKTIDGITYVYTDLMKSSDNIQAKASTGTIKNSTAYSGDIISVAITHSGTARATTINGSANGTDWVQVATGSGSITADFSGKGYKYFQITRGSNAAYWTQIVITYSDGGPSTYAVTYNGNGNTSGDVPVDNTGYDDENNIVTVLGNTGDLAKTGYTFGGWNTAANGSGTSYAAGAQFTISANTTLYAQWIPNKYSYTLNVTGGNNLDGDVEIFVPDQTGWESGDQIEYGQQVTVSVVPLSGYTYTTTVTYGDNDIVPVENDMFTMPDADVTITVVVTEDISWTYTHAANDGSGNISGTWVYIEDSKFKMQQTKVGSTNMVTNATEIRLYKDHYLELSPVSTFNKVMTSVVITCQNGYADDLAGSTFIAGGSSSETSSLSSGDVTYNGNVVTIDLSHFVNCAYLKITAGAQIRFTSVTVNYTNPVVVTNHNITYASGLTHGSWADGKPESAYTGALVTVTTTPDTDYHLSSMTYSDGGSVSGNANIDGNIGSFIMPDADVTITAEFAPNITYTLATSIVPGKHYIITNGTDKAMGLQNTNNRAAVNVAIENGVATVSSLDVYEFVISGPDTDGYYTIYDTDDLSTGYLYAVAGDNYLKTDATLSSSGKWSIVFDDDVAKLTVSFGSTKRQLKYNAGNDIFSCYTSGQDNVYLYVKDGDTDLEFYSPTTVSSLSTDNGEVYTVKKGGTLNITGTSNHAAANLIIEDGGQLVTNNAVNATMEKDITAWTTGEHAGGWYFIASPVKGSIAPNTVGNLVANTAEAYDLYQLDPNTTKWQNWKTGEGNNAAPGFDLVNGKGYLYANQNAVSLEFAGEVLPSNTDQAVGVSAGWNLIGNPFTCNAYLSGASFYKLNSDRTAIESSTGGDAIAPCKGVIIIIKDATNSVTFSKNAPAQNAVNNGSVQIALTEANTRGNSQLDNAIVSFNEGSQLEKFYFGTQNANLYIPQNNEEYAIAYSDRQGELPVNFVANQNGEYTLSISPENVDMNYLHLIDNMTGADIDLVATPSYTFDARTTDYASRFRLVFSANSCNDNNDNTPFAFVSNGEIRFVETLSETAQIQVVDMMGRVVVSRSGDVSGNVSTSGMTAGVYVIRLIDGNRVRTQKMVID